MTNDKPIPIFLPWSAVLERIGKLSRDTRDRWEREGRFPKRINIGVHRVVWLESEIIEWQRQRIAARDQDAAFSGGSVDHAQS